jgi:hypothetical protein
LRSPEAALIDKERRELASSRGFVLLLVLLGPLVGHAFITAVQSYAEASGAPGGPAALAQGLSPLDGLVVPTFGAYALASTLLFPFVAVGAVSWEKQNGLLKLLLQSPVGVGKQLSIKVALLLLAWIVAWIPGLAALALWAGYGGHLHAPETMAVLLGHLLRAALTCGVAIAAAAVTDGAATAAVLTLAVTLGSWALDFIAQVRGGVAQRLAAYTPDAALRTFERGEIRLSTIAVTIALTIAGVLFARVWLHPGRTSRSRALSSAFIVGVIALTSWIAAGLRTSWDVSEDRRNSFSAEDERALAQLRGPLRITVHLAPEDPRLADLERGVLRKLRRTVRDVDIAYASRGSSGLFEGSGAGYGEVWYAANGRREMSRSTTEPIVLETIYRVAGILPPPPAQGRASAYSGYPLRHEPDYAGLMFYGLWPLLVVSLWWWSRRSSTSQSSLSS